MRLLIFGGGLADDFIVSFLLFFVIRVVLFSSEVPLNVKQNPE